MHCALCCVLLQAYDAYFDQIPLPIDFPITGIDVFDPSNGPAIMQAAALIKSSPFVNVSTFRNFYEGYTEFCTKSSTLPTCDSCASTMVDGYLTGESFSKCFYFTQFLGNPEYQQYAADMGISTTNLGIPEFNGVCKFGVYTNDGALAGYEGQLALPAAMNELSQAVSALFAGGNGTAANATDPAPEVFAYSAVSVCARRCTPVRHPIGVARAHRSGAAPPHQRLLEGVLTVRCLQFMLTRAPLGADDVITPPKAFPYFETWKPARDDLVDVGIATLAGASITSFFFLGWGSFVVHTTVLLAGTCGLLVVTMLGLEADLNLVTATNVFTAVPIMWTALFHTAFRFSATMETNESSGGAFRDLQEYWSKCMRPAYLSYLIIAGVGGAIFFLCDSPINLLFVYIHELTIAISLLMALVLMPVLLSIPLAGWVCCKSGAALDSINNLYG